MHVVVRSQRETVVQYDRDKVGNHDDNVDRCHYTSCRAQNEAQQQDLRSSRRINSRPGPSGSGSCARLSCQLASCSATAAAECRGSSPSIAWCAPVHLPPICGLPVDGCFCQSCCRARGPGSLATQCAALMIITQQLTLVSLCPLRSQCPQAPQQQLFSQQAAQGRGCACH